MSKFVINYCGDLSTEITHIDSNSKILTDAPKDNSLEGPFLLQISYHLH